MSEDEDMYNEEGEEDEEIDENLQMRDEISDDEDDEVQLKCEEEAPVRKMKGAS
jgi:hypothetical protein